MPAKAGIQNFKYLNKIKSWIPAFAGMTALFSDCETVSREEEAKKESFEKCLDGVGNGPVQ